MWGQVQVLEASAVLLGQESGVVAELLGAFELLVHFESEQRDLFQDLRRPFRHLMV
jgi:hypothetical protein